MKSVHFPSIVRRLTAIFCMAAVCLLIAGLTQGAEERPQRPPRMSAEELEKVWTTEATCAAGALKMSKEETAKMVKAYVGALKAYQEKVQALPRTRESFEQRRELAEKAQADLKAALAKAVGEEKAGKALAAMGPFGMRGFGLDRMVNELLGFKLPKEKLSKAVAAVMKYNVELNKVFTAARDSGDREGMREKMQGLSEALNKELSGLLSEEQMATWKESRSRRFGPRRTQQ